VSSPRGRLKTSDGARHERRDTRRPDADGHPTQWTGLLQIQPEDVGQDYQATICLPDFDHGDFGSPAYFTQVTIRRL